MNTTCYRWYGRGPRNSRSCFHWGALRDSTSAKTLIKENLWWRLTGSSFWEVWGGNEHPSKDDLKQKIITRYRHGDKIKWFWKNLTVIPLHNRAVYKTVYDFTHLDDKMGTLNDYTWQQMKVGLKVIFLIQI